MPALPMKFAPLRSVGAAVLAICLLLAGTGCSAESSDLSLAGQGPKIVTGTPAGSDTASAADAAGTLVTASGGCLHLQDGAETILLIFPEGSEPLTDGQPGVRLSGGELLVGQDIAVSGNYAALDEDEARDITSCRPGDRVLVVSQAAQR